MDLPVSPLAPERFPNLPKVGGMRIATHALGLYKGRIRDDLLVVHFPAGAAAGGVFTISQTRSADVDWCREALKAAGGKAQVLVVNAGNSNAFTGEKGLAKNRATVAMASKMSGCPAHEVFLAATGVIGEPLAPNVVADGVGAAWEKLAAPDWEKAANAIRTTDTFAKAAGETADLNRRNVAIAGFAKGSGMIMPNMATTLNYVFTDAALTPRVCQALIAKYADLTYNCITVDGDTSTSDTLMLFATGAAGGEPIDNPDDPRLAGFCEALHRVLKDLALQIVRDGEGATKLIEIEITGAASDKSAKAIGASIANSPLVKTALAAGDANWGRVVMAVGKAGEPVERDRLEIHFGDHLVARDGCRSPDYSEARATEAVQGPEIRILVDVGVGRGKATVWTCDLTDGYVKINGAYRS
ncbi:MAG TPA: bifunctional glutamate N-acetyltransferase/amino-acid acetyltransferase ArgJ [Hyphomonadaceae bacterium]|nr:bifunctional glutamate N-acetyltransferase/amino-acid acetyltransferase ArgJ [Hyphomonadaceae bacterium]